MKRKLAFLFASVLAGIVVVLLSIHPNVYAALPTEAQLPIGLPLSLTFRAYAGAGTTAGILVAYDEQWIVIRDEKGLLHWVQYLSVRNVDPGVAPAPAAAPAPAPEPAPAAPAPAAPAPAAPANP